MKGRAYLQPNSMDLVTGTANKKASIPLILLIVLSPLLMLGCSSLPNTQLPSYAKSEKGPKLNWQACLDAMCMQENPEVHQVLVRLGYQRGIAQ
jgi:hypothetical protein